MFMCSLTTHALHTFLALVCSLTQDPDAIRKVLNDNGPEGFVMVLHPSGKRILGDNNIAFTHGPKHKALRASFLPLFGRKALGVYLQFQEHLIRTHIDKWLRATAGAAVEVRELCRELNQETSQTVFVGPYLDNPVQVRAAATTPRTCSYS